MEYAMWSHYADGHKGYCLEFDANNEHFGVAHQVKYVDQYPAFEALKTSVWDQLEIIFLTKHRGWEYEDEWRVIDHVDGLGLKNYLTELLTGVIYGMNMSECHERKIRKWVKQREFPVRFYQAIREERRFALRSEEVK